MLASKYMKTGLLAILLILCSSCINENSKREVVANLDEKILYAFKEAVLDSLIGQDLLVDIPNFSGLFSADLYLKYDSTYFDMYFDKVTGFKWRGKGIVQKKEIDEFFKNDNESGYEEFRNKYGQRCFVRISVPFLSADQREVFFTLDRHCSPLGGYGMNYHYKMENGKWKLVSSSETWVS